MTKKVGIERIMNDSIEIKQNTSTVVQKHFLFRKYKSWPIASHHIKKSHPPPMNQACSTLIYVQQQPKIKFIRHTLKLVDWLWSKFILNTHETLCIFKIVTMYYMFVDVHILCSFFYRCLVPLPIRIINSIINFITANASAREKWKMNNIYTLATLKTKPNRTLFIHVIFFFS